MEHTKTFDLFKPLTSAHIKSRLDKLFTLFTIMTAT